MNTPIDPAIATRYAMALAADHYMPGLCFVRAAQRLMLTGCLRWDDDISSLPPDENTPHDVFAWIDPATGTLHCYDNTVFYLEGVFP